MEYKFYNSNTLKSVNLNEDTNLVFELTKVNNDNVFLNTLLYSSQYGCPISLSLIEKVNSTKDIGFGSGTVLDFMYKIVTDSNGQIKIEHPTESEEEFLLEETIVDSDGVTNYYYYSDTTTAYIRKTEINDTPKYYLFKDNFFAIYEDEEPYPKQFSRNGLNEKQLITVDYKNNKVVKLTNALSKVEIVEIDYDEENKILLTASKQLRRGDKYIDVTKVEITLSNNKVNCIKEFNGDYTVPVRNTTFTRTPSYIIVKNEITNLFSKVTLLDNVVSLIEMQEDTMTISYEDDYQTNISVNGMLLKYFFDCNYNLQHIENSVGEVKTFQYDNSVRRLLLSESSTLYAKNSKNTTNLLTHDQKEIISYNSYTFEGEGTYFSGCPAGYKATRVTICDIEEDQETNFAFRFNKQGKKFDVENLVLWYKMVSIPSDAKDSDIYAHLFFYKYDSNKDVLINTQSIKINSKITSKWMFNILAAQANEDYDCVEVRFFVNRANYSMNISVELMSDSFVNIYNYDSRGRINKFFDGKKTYEYKYNRENNLISSTNTVMSYDQYGHIYLSINSNNILQTIKRDKYDNVISRKTMTKNGGKYIKNEYEYEHNEYLVFENTENNSNVFYEYDDNKKINSIECNGTKTTFSYLNENDSNNGRISKIKHSYQNGDDYIDMCGSQVSYNSNTTIKNFQNLNAESIPNCIFTYTYDSFLRLKTISFGSVELANYSYLFENNRRIVSLQLNNQTISYLYDENERLVSKSIDGDIVFEYIYDENTTRLLSINDFSTNETTSFEYEGNILKSVTTGSLKIENQFNVDKSLLIEKLYKDNLLLSMNKYSGKIAAKDLDNILKFEEYLFEKEEDRALFTSFIERKVGLGDSSKDLYNFNKTKIVQSSDTLNTSLLYGYDGLPFVKILNENAPLMYSFNSNWTYEGMSDGFSENYSIFFGFKSDHLEKTIPILKISNNIDGFYKSINLYASEAGLNFVQNPTIPSTGPLQLEGELNFVTLNVSVTPYDNKYKYKLSAYLNGVLLKELENVLIEHKMNQIYLFGAGGNNVISGNIYSLIVKQNELMSIEDINLYTSRLKQIYTDNNRPNEEVFNKKTRLSRMDIPTIFFDYNFDSTQESVKVNKLIFNNGSKSFDDYFTIDTESKENVMVLRNQTVTYKTLSAYEGYTGVKFKPIEGVATNIMSLDDNNAFIHIKVDSNMNLIVETNSSTTVLTTLDLSWNTILLKWQKTVVNESMDSLVYQIKVYVNDEEFILTDLSITGTVNLMTFSVGKYHNSTDNTYGCYGYIEKAIVSGIVASASEMNLYLNNSGENVVNVYDELNYKQSKYINTANHKTMIHTFNYDQASDGRLLNRLISDTFSISNSNNILNTYTYSADNSISSMRTRFPFLSYDVTKYYTYDNKKQLTNYFDGTNTYEYIYDERGNITNIKKNNTSIYNATFKDGILIDEVKGSKINSVNGYPVSKSVHGTTVETYLWDGGKLSQIEYLLTGVKIKFEYAANGLRTTKREYRNNTIYNTTKYYYNPQGLLVYETRTVDNTKLEYLYDAEGSLYGVHHNNTPYYYVKDALNNINYIADANGNIVTEIKYNGAYGSHTIVDINSEGSTHISFINPFRYKGYYYDVETGWFWLSSRYYSPELCRFISPDDVGYLDPTSINGLNLYAYCMNDPINYADPSGHIAISTLILCGLALVGMGLTIGGVASDNNVMTAIGLTMVAVPALISGVGALFSGATYLSIIGGVTAGAGAFTGAFAVAEYQEAFTGNNWIIDTTGMSEELYNGLMLATAAIATAGTIATGVLTSVGNAATPNQMMNSFNKHPNRWKTVKELVEPGRGANKGGISTYSNYINKWTGSKMGIHKIIRGGRFIHGPHFHPWF